jgi:hypothetical protein
MNFDKIIPISTYEGIVVYYFPSTPNLKAYVEIIDERYGTKITISIDTAKELANIIISICKNE